MAEIVALLVDEVLPHEPIRQLLPWMACSRATHRYRDVTNESNTGVVVEGTEFSFPTEIPVRQPPRTDGQSAGYRLSRYSIPTSSKRQG
jgi:hypothetical protein